MGKQEDIAAASGLVRTLDKAVTALSRHYTDSVDVQRLRLDLGRLREDLDLLCGTPPVAAAAPPAPPLREVIADTPYAHDFWMDAEDEGLGSSGAGRR